MCTARRLARHAHPFRTDRPFRRFQPIAPTVLMATVFRDRTSVAWRDRTRTEFGGTDGEGTDGAFSGSFRDDSVFDMSCQCSFLLAHHLGGRSMEGGVGL